MESTGAHITLPRIALCLPHPRPMQPTWKHVTHRTVHSHCYCTVIDHSLWDNMGIAQVTRLIG